MNRIIAIYTLAVAVALFLVLTSPLFLAYYGTLATFAAALYLMSGVLVAAFIIDYMKYAIREWQDFTPQSFALAALFPFAYAVMYMSLMAGSGVNLVIWASAAVSAALIFYALRAGAPLTSGDVIGDLKAGTKTWPLALAVGFPLGWLFAAGYEAYRMIKNGAKVAGATVFLSIALAFIFPVFSITSNSLKLQFGILDVLLWPGAIAWEELTTRFLLPVVGPTANYMFVVLHAPSRWLGTLFLAPAILAVISLGTRWLTDVFRRHGLLGSISAHAVYNGQIMWLWSLFIATWSQIAAFIILAWAYFTRPKE